jgi:hypothetical protein
MDSRLPVAAATWSGAEADPGWPEPETESPVTTRSPGSLKMVKLSDVVDLRDQIQSVTSAAALPLFKGMLHAGVGEGESGKTWIAAHAVADVADEVKSVLVLDGEMSAPAWRRRLIALGIGQDSLQLVNYCEMTDTSADVANVIEACAEAGRDGWPPVQLIVWDSALSMLSRTARSENDNAEVARVYDKLREIVRVTDAAGFIVDHVTRGSSSLVSRGATAKFNALDISYGVRLADGSVPSPLAPWSSLISVEKDRHGLLGKRADREASFTPRSDGGVHLDICELAAATHRLAAGNPTTKSIGAIAALDPPPISASDAFRRLGGNRKTVLDAFKLWKEQ